MSDSASPFASSQAPLQRAFLRFALLFVGLLALLLPFPHALIPSPGTLLAPATESLIAALSSLLGLKHPQKITSDSGSMYILAGFVLLVAMMGTMAWTFLTRGENDDRKLTYVFLTGMRYYLAIYLLEYGFNKVFKAQFYLPEPNTLATPLGDLSPDLLFWSTMGVSRGYCVFTGLLEVLAGALLLHGRTRVAGALLGAAVMFNVLAINLFFDISVKLFSAFLLLQCLLLLLPDYRRLWAFLTGAVAPRSALWSPVWDSLRKRMVYLLAKTVLVCLLLFNCLFPYFQAWNFNDDAATRPELHGYYEVPSFIRNNDTISPDLRADRWRRVFIHRRGYFITQDMRDVFQDHQMALDSGNTVMTLTRADNLQKSVFQIHALNDSTLQFQGNHGGDLLKVVVVSRNWREMPLLQPSFHWTSDEM